MEEAPLPGILVNGTNVQYGGSAEVPETTAATNRAEKFVGLRIALALKHWDGMVQFSRLPLVTLSNFTTQELELLCLGYRHAILDRLGIYECLKEEEEKIPEIKTPKGYCCNVYLQRYKAKIRNEALEIGAKANYVAEQLLGREEKDAALEVYSWKFRADCARYCSSICENEVKEQFVSFSMGAYDQALVAAKDSKDKVPAYLLYGTLINKMAFKKESFGNTQQAMKEAVAIFKDAIADMYRIEDEEEYQAVLRMLRKIRQDVQDWGEALKMTLDEINTLLGIAGDVDAISSESSEDLNVESQTKTRINFVIPDA